MATIKAVLNKDRQKKHGEYSLVIQIIHNRLKRVIYTPYQLRVDEFDPVTQKALYIKGALHTRKQIKEINDFLGVRRKELETIVKQIGMYNKNFTTEDIVAKHRMTQSERYLITFIESCIEKKTVQGKMGTARAYRSTLLSLEKYVNKRTIEFADVDHHFIKGYEEFLSNRKVKQNTISFYMRNFRSIYNLACDSGVEVGAGNAFHKIKIKTVKTVKRALKQEVLVEITLLDLSAKPNLEKARDLFMFSFYTRGMSFVDIIHLKHSDIVDGVICYHRRKTDQLIEVAITPPLQKLMNKYNTDQLYVLPFINECSKATLYQQYQAVYGTFYRNLNALQELLNLTTPLTTYVARHSWATIAKELGAPTSIISESLGHTSEKTTQIYLKEFDRSVIDLINEKIVSFSTTQYAKH